MAANTPASVKRSRKARTDAAPDQSRLSDEAFLAALGGKVREMREMHALSRKSLAETADVSERYLAQLEAGQGNASIVLLRRVAAALNVSLVSLIGVETTAQRARAIRLIDSLPESRVRDLTSLLLARFGTDEGVRRKRIALIGLRGAGKSTLGAALAKAIRRPFIELDRQIEREAGMPLAEVFMLYGQPGYRNLERRCLERVIAEGTDLVLSVGGGIVSERDSYQLLLDNCFTVWIKALPAEHMSRVVAQGDLRPMQGHAQAMEDLKALLAARESQYARADAVVDTSGQTVTKSLVALRGALDTSRA
jgi:XRE family aerobic/anaerobic benzoate catabolism transcriptional regulator